MEKTIPRAVKDVRITFIEEVLGVSPSDPNVYENFIASKGPDAMSVSDEIEAYGADDVLERGTTVFPRDEYDRPCLWNYQVKGYFKDACGMLARIKKPATAASKLKAYKKVIDGLIFIEPRLIPVIMPKGGGLGLCERPLRAATARGERVALARSETVPAGSHIDVKIITLGSGKEYEDLIEELLKYGVYHGFLGWRNSGKGVFTWKELNLKAGANAA